MICLAQQSTVREAPSCNHLLCPETQAPLTWVSGRHHPSLCMLSCFQIVTELLWVNDRTGSLHMPPEIGLTICGTVDILTPVPSLDCVFKTTASPTWCRPVPQRLGLK